MEQTLESAGLDYELTLAEREDVQKRYPNVYFPEPTLEPVFYGRRDKVRIPEKRAIVDQKVHETTQSPGVYGICSEAYKIIHYEDIIHMVENSVGALTDYGKVQVCPTTYLDGGRLRINVKFPEMKSEIKKVDSIIPKVDVFSSYDLSTKLTGKFGAWQLKCTNGMGIWKSMQRFAKRHLQNLFLNDFGNTISEGMLIFGEQVNTWKNWASTQIEKEIYETIWDELPFSKAERTKIEALPEIGTQMLLSKAVETNTLDLWGLNSVLTQFATHEVKSELRRIDLEPAIARSMELLYAKTTGGIH